MLQFANVAVGDTANWDLHLIAGSDAIDAGTTIGGFSTDVDEESRPISLQWEMEADAVHRAYAKARKEFHSCLREAVSYHAVRTEADIDAECRRLFASFE